MDVETHRRRLQNLADAHRAVRSCMREHRIGEYLAGQVTYNLGEYPARFSIAPTAYDYQLLQQLAEHGVALIQVHEEWNDSQRCLGADKFTSHDPKGFRAFVDLVHSLGMRIIPYVSTGFLEAADPDLNPEWIVPGVTCTELYFDYVMCSPASPEWRAYLLPRLEGIMDEYGVDGLYDDLGYVPLYKHQSMHPTHIPPGDETPDHDASLEDLLWLVADLIRARGGVLKIHWGDQKVAFKDKVYDYLWVGEQVADLDKLRAEGKGLAPYVVPCPDLSAASVVNEDDLYLHFVPYMQFPQRIDGRPCTGQRAALQGVTYHRGEQSFGTRYMRTVWRHYQEHPDAPPMYGAWDSFPGRPEGRARWLHHLDLYRPMVKGGTRVWIDINDSAVLDHGKAEGLTASLFVNDEMYLVLANYSHTSIEVTSCWTWRDRESGSIGTTLKVPPRKLLYLQRTADLPEAKSGQVGTTAIRAEEAADLQL